MNTYPEGKLPPLSYIPQESHEPMQSQIENEEDKDLEEHEENEQIPKKSKENLAVEKTKEEILHASRPFFFSTLIVNAPFIVLFSSLAIMVVLTIITIATGSMENTPEHRRDFLVWDSTPVKEYDMQYLAEEKVQTNYPGGVQPLRSTTNEISTTFLIYQ